MCEKITYVLLVTIAVNYCFVFLCFSFTLGIIAEKISSHSPKFDAFTTSNSFAVQYVRVKRSLEVTFVSFSWHINKMDVT